MKKRMEYSTDTRKCVMCCKKTDHYRAWCYTDGIEITVPICTRCKDKITWCIDNSMDLHLKAIQQTVRLSAIITYDENRITELQEGKV